MTGTVLLIHEDYQGYMRPIQDLLPDAPIKPYRNPEEAGADLDEAEAIISFGRWMTPEYLARLKNLKWFQCLITGVDHLMPYFKGRDDIILTNGRGIHGPQMTEMVLLHMLFLNRSVSEIMRNKAAHRWQRLPVRGLERKTAVIVGVGAIAEHCAKVLKSLDMTVVGVSGSPRDIPGFDKVMPRSELVQAAAEADFLIVLAPYTPENDKMINAEVLGAMKPTAFLVNVARGGVADEDAVVEALRSGKIAGAGLDVFATQPLPETSPLWEMDNVFITPQLGGQTDLYSRKAAETFIVPNLKHWLAGEPDKLVNVIDK